MNNKINSNINHGLDEKQKWKKKKKPEQKLQEINKQMKEWKVDLNWATSFFQE